MLPEPGFVDAENVATSTTSTASTRKRWRNFTSRPDDHGGGGGDVAGGSGTVERHRHGACRRGAVRDRLRAALEAGRLDVHGDVAVFAVVVDAGDGDVLHLTGGGVLDEVVGP